MDVLFIGVIVVIIASLVFEYINGFHDAANAIATVVSTKVLTPRSAILYGAILNIFGALMGTHVAKTISGGILNAGFEVTQFVIVCALLSAIIWNLITWFFGIPSSSSHALIGGLIGAAMTKFNYSVVNFHGVIEKVIKPMIISPIIGLTVGFFFMLLLLWLTYKSNPDKINRKFKKMQLISSGIMAFSHGSNDAQKTMGIITLALFSANYIKTTDVIPLWVILSCAVTMGLGTMAGGWKIIRTMGSKVIKLRPIHGFAAETASAAVILSASHFGFPVSTTHIISTAIMGVGSTVRLSAVKWGLVGNMVLAWIITIPTCMLIASAIYFSLNKLFHLA